MKLICMLALSLAFALPAIAEEPSAPPSLPQDFDAWQKRYDSECGVKEKTIRVITYAKQPNGEVIQRIYRGRDFVKQQRLTKDGRILTHVQFPQGTWTSYELPTDLAKMRAQELRALGVTKDEFQKCWRNKL